MNKSRRNILSTLFSLALSAALVSGIDSVSKAAMAIVLIITCLGYLLLPVIIIMAEQLRETQPPRWLSLSLAIIQWSALLYAGYSYVFAVSFVLAILLSIIYSASKPKED